MSHGFPDPAKKAHTLRKSHGAGKAGKATRLIMSHVGGFFLGGGSPHLAHISDVAFGLASHGSSSLSMCGRFLPSRVPSRRTTSRHFSIRVRFRRALALVNIGDRVLFAGSAPPSSLSARIRARPSISRRGDGRQMEGEGDAAAPAVFVRLYKYASVRAQTRRLFGGGLQMESTPGSRRHGDGAPCAAHLPA